VDLCGDRNAQPRTRKWGFPIIGAVLHAAFSESVRLAFAGRTNKPHQVRTVDTATGILDPKKIASF
jgi:hypothetical protein